jgi:hypothetical protein
MLREGCYTTIPSSPNNSNSDSGTELGACCVSPPTDESNTLSAHVEEASRSNYDISAIMFEWGRRRSEYHRPPTPSAGHTEAVRAFVIPGSHTTRTQHNHREGSLQWGQRTLKKRHVAGTTPVNATCIKFFHHTPHKHTIVVTVQTNSTAVQRRLT